MGSIKGLDSTGIYAYTTLISALICVPAALIMEGPYLKAAADRALAAHPNFYTQLALVGLLYHLYNQVSRPALPSDALPARCLARRQPCLVTKRMRVPFHPQTDAGPQQTAHARSSACPYDDVHALQHVQGPAKRVMLAYMR